VRGVESRRKRVVMYVRVTGFRRSIRLCVEVGEENARYQ